jgi:hypothetical protein
MDDDVKEYFRQKIKKWKRENHEKVLEQKARYRKKHPDMMDASRIRFLEKKFIENPDFVPKGELRNDFDRLTRLLFDDKLPKKCEICGSISELQIHHKQYKYPIVIEDLVRLCREHHLGKHRMKLRKTSVKEICKNLNYFFGGS